MRRHGCRIHGELKDVGHRVASTTIAIVLKANGIKPAPDRPPSWKTFLRAHWGQVAATDFFITEAWTPRGLVTFYTLFVIDLETRRVEIAGITVNPTGAFVAQVARNLTDVENGFLKDHRILICDRDTKFTDQFKRILSDAGVEVVLTPKRAPNCNAFAERFVLSIKSECLGRMIFFGGSADERSRIVLQPQRCPLPTVGRVSVPFGLLRAGFVHQRRHGLLLSDGFVFCYRWRRMTQWIRLATRSALPKRETLCARHDSLSLHR